MWTYKYDAFGRQVEVRQEPAGQPVRVSAQQYDAEGRLTLADTPEGIIAYSYDNLGRKTATKVYPVGANPAVDTPERITSHTYDALSRLKSVSEDLDPASTTDEVLNTAYTYDLRGNLDRTDLPNGVVSDYVFDSLDRLDKRTDYAPDATPEDLSNNPKLAEYDYTVCADGKRTAATETFWLDADSNPSTPSTPHVNQIAWTYDDLGRLTDEVFNHFDEALDQTDHFSYDLVGNRLSTTKDKGNNASIDEGITYSYDANDRLIEELFDADNSGTTDRATTYGWTRTQQTLKHVTAGTSSVSRQTYSYDLQGRMFQVVIEEYVGGALSARGRVTFEYDAAGFRISSLHEADPNLNEQYQASSRVDFAVDHHNFTGFPQAIKETTYDAQGTAIKTVEYTFGRDEIAQTITPYVNGVANAANAVTHVFGHDGHTSVRILLDMAAAILQLYAFDSYGELLSIHDGTAQFEGAAAIDALTSLLYSGEHFDAQIAQQYLRARFYDPATGRFNRLDPFGGDMQGPQSLHKYLYAHADPIQGTDPTGMFTLGSVQISMSIGGFLQGMNAFSRYAAKQFAFASIETTIEVLIGKLLETVTGVKFDLDAGDVYRSVRTNFVSNLATAGFGSKTRKAVLIRNLLDFAIRTVMDVVFDGKDLLWSAAVNLVAMGTSGILLSKYGSKLFGKCLEGRFGGCFVAGTPVVVAFEPDLEWADDASDGATIVDCRPKTVTKAIETIRLGSRVITEPPDYLPTDCEFGEPDQATWREITLLHHRGDGVEIQMELIRPQWWIDLLGLKVGSVIELPRAIASK